MKKNYYRNIVTMIITLPLVIGCATQNEHKLVENIKVQQSAPVSSVVEVKTLPEISSYTQVGLASWYGREFHGKRTAGGNIYNRRSLTAAHPTLPLPSTVRVTNLSNGKTVDLVVHDRGPVSKKRIIDVSEKAAEVLDMKRAGIARVKVELMATVPQDYFIQIGSYDNKNSAMTIMNNLSNIGNIKMTNQYLKGVLKYKLRIGPFKDKKQAVRLLAKIKNSGSVSAVIL
jgi:rare lipoprotein A